MGARKKCSEKKGKAKENSKRCRRSLKEGGGEALGTALKKKKTSQDKETLSRPKRPDKKN